MFPESPKTENIGHNQSLHVEENARRILTDEGVVVSWGNVGNSDLEATQSDVKALGNGVV